MLYRAALNVSIAIGCIHNIQWAVMPQADSLFRYLTNILKNVQNKRFQRELSVSDALLFHCEGIVQNELA